VLFLHVAKERPFASIKVLEFVATWKSNTAMVVTEEQHSHNVHGQMRLYANLFFQNFHAVVFVTLQGSRNYAHDEDATAVSVRGST
jgi:hypothetical protein